MSLAHFQVALWKNIHTRRYNRVLTFLEFIVPILIFYEGLSFRELLQPISNENETSTRKFALNKTSHQNFNITIVYTPKNSSTLKIIEDVAKRLGVDHYESTTDVSALKSHLTDSLNRTTSKLQKMFGVYFRSDLNNDKKFKYTIVTLYPYLLKDSRRIFADTFEVAKDKKEALTIPYYIATEKHSGMKEMMKMTGISELTIWFGWITYSLMIYPFVTIIIVIILKTGVTSDPFYNYVDPTLVWMILILYSIANMVFLFAISSVITKHWVAIVFSMVISFLSSAPVGLTSFTNAYDDQGWNYVRHALLCFCPNLVLYNSLKALQYFELKEKNTSWSSVVTDINDPQIYSLRSILTYFVLNIILNSIVVIYVSTVRPGRFGYGKHPLFFITAIFKFFRKRKKSIYMQDSDSLANQFIEPLDENEIGIQIQDLHKHFGYFIKHSALKNVNLNIPRGEITVILGHNGAGKSTLLNAICGMSSKTGGELYQNIDGELRNTHKLIGKLGFCPQHIIYFNYLTLEEHILFFGMARGLTQTKATREAKYLLNVFEMQEKNSNFVYELSGGMRRKLGLLIALIGRPQILILDEPTSGMDVNSRRMTWDVLKKIKRNRIIIMATQDMEEADVVGNRIAIMHDGQIFCYGRSNFLKELFGTGYNLTLSKGYDFDEENTTNLIQSVISSASVTSNTESTIDYNLPLLGNNSFSTLFRFIEENMAALSITHIQMSCTTMDQVFLNVTFLADKNTEKSSNVTQLPTKDLPIELRSGISLVVLQMVALFMKKFKLAYRRHNRFLIYILLAVLLGCANIYILTWNYSIFGSTQYPWINFELKTYPHSQSIIFHLGDDQSEFKKLYKEVVESGGSHVRIENNVDVAEKISAYGNHNLYEYRDNLVAGVVLTKTEKKVLYNELIPHSPPISLNIYSNALLRYLLKNTSYNESSIQAAYEPVSATQRSTNCAESDISSLTLPLFWWIFIFHSALLALFVFFISFVISERVHGIKHIQTMSDLSEWTYWLGNFIFDFLFYVFIVVIIVSFMKIMDNYSFLPIEDLKFLIKALLLYGVSGLLYCYVFSSLFDSISIFMLINVVLNICCLVSFYAMEMRNSRFVPMFKILTAILPPFSFLNFLARFLYIEINNNHCVYCQDFEKSDCRESVTKIGMDDDIQMTKDKHIDSAIIFMKFLYVDILLYGILLYLLNSMWVAKLCNSLTSFIFGKKVFIDPNDERDEDKFVLAEKQYVKDIFDRNKPSNHALMVHNLKKNIIVPGFHKFTAVADVNFYVDKSSCFGIVGINGAGKSTTFKILTAFMLPTDGDAKVHNISLQKQLKKYTSMIGSCPQSNTTFEELTAREMLHLHATLRGLKDADKHVKNWISVLNMEHFQDSLIETYSSGGKRKLCVALSLIGDPKVVFLDEPTSGVDPVARQSMYQIIKSKKLAGQSVVIASHNMRECEILCDRVTVLHNGVLKRIGSISALKKQYANGFTLVVKLHLVMDYTDRVVSLIETILKKFEKFRCSIRDQRLGILKFRILSERILWSEMFGKMEDVKRLYNMMIEDYIITNATIAEEIFLLSLSNPES
ncbi:retinal-specific phospholipid-transporting ATPase ABCA4-like [Planococcus citri]|uniref:retinal-specific phospholipid-transporting ATPase ABCA4-like n=1 Tax=Planococcus citri TaxID=170843 RepID=UPI0031F72FEF